MYKIADTGGYWTVPILPIAKDQRQIKWNKPLAMIQAFLIPTAVSTVLKFDKNS